MIKLVSTALMLVAAGITAAVDSSIAVDLQANWITPPFEVSLIESICAENSTAFYPMVSSLVALNEANGPQSDEEYHKELMNHAVDAGLITRDQVEYVDWALALHTQSALIQAYYQYFDTSVKPNLDSKYCENALEYNGKVTCDKDAVFALETNAGRDVDILPSDRVLGTNEQAPIAVLYADLSSESFPVFHSHLVSSAMNNKIQYILRHKPPAKKTPKENLSGYGLELALKRTDYIVIDDRKNENVEKKDEELISEDDNAKINKFELEKLGLRASNYIMTSSNKFEALVNLSMNFPKVMGAIAKMAPDRNVRLDVLENAKTVMEPGQSAILINGAPAFHHEQNAFTLFETIKRERKLIDSLKRFGLSSGSAAQLIQDNLLDQQDESTQKRYDYRTSGLIWLNDIELDPDYEEFPSDLKLFLNKDFPGQFYPIRHNANSLVMAVDMSSPRHLSLLGQAMGLIQRGLPIQIGVVPLVDSFEGKAIAQELEWLSQNKVSKTLQNYLVSLLTGIEHQRAFKTVLKGEKVPDVDKDLQVQATMEQTSEWSKRFDIPEDTPMIFANGVVIAHSNNWLREASTILTDDLDEIRKLVKKGTPGPHNPIRDLLLQNALKRRNVLVYPADPSSVAYMETSKFADAGGFSIGSEDSDVTLYHTGDFANPEPLLQLVELMKLVDSSKARMIVLPIVDQVQKNTNLRQKRREAVVKALHSVKNAEANDLAKGIAALHDHHFDSKKEQSAESFKMSLGWDDDFAQIKDDDAEDISQEITDKLQYVGPSHNLIVAGRVVELSKNLDYEDLVELVEVEKGRVTTVLNGAKERGVEIEPSMVDQFVSSYTKTYHMDSEDDFFIQTMRSRLSTAHWSGNHSLIEVGSEKDASIKVTAAIDPLSEKGQEAIAYLQTLSQLKDVSVKVYLNPILNLKEVPLKRFYRSCLPVKPHFNDDGERVKDVVHFDNMSQDTLYNMEIHVPKGWLVDPEISDYDLENIVLNSVQEEELRATYELRNILLEGHAQDITKNYAPRGLALDLGINDKPVSDTIVMANLGYLQFQANPGYWTLGLKPGRSTELFDMVTAGLSGFYSGEDSRNKIWMDSMTGTTIYPRFKRKKGQENADVLDSSGKQGILKWNKKNKQPQKKQADVNIFTVASGHLYERFLSIMTKSVMEHSNHTVKFWLIEQFLSPSFKEFLPYLAEQLGFEYELVTYKWPHWLRGQREKQRTIWGYKILFLDVLFPQSLDKVIFVDADQIVRTDLKELVDLDLQGAPYGYTPMCDSREEIEGFRFWKQGYWKTFLGDKFKYHISALYVVDLNRFRQMAAGDRIRQHYQQLSADPNSLSNLDQDLPNNMQTDIPIFSLPQDWLWCETWCSDESLKTAKTIDLCNNPMTKEPKLDRARRQVPEWTAYDDFVADLNKKFDSLKSDQPDADDEGDEPEEEVDGVEIDHDEL